MGGQKKKSLGQKSKPRSEPTKDGKGGKKGEKQEGGSKRAEITVSLNKEQALKIIRKSKVITVQDLAKQTGVKISTANAFFRKTLQSGAVKRVGGHSGHYVYQPVLK